MNKDAVLEIGSEELPASFIGSGMAQLKEIAEASLKENNLSVQSISVYGTPRRLALVLTGLADKSLDQRRTIPGPPIGKAKDSAGQWTPAAVGFAGKHGLEPNELIIENDRLCAVMDIKGTPTRQLLGQLFPLWIQRLQFPKTMTWEPTHFRFPRPIRWITALYGHDLIRFQLAGVSSGKTTFGLGLQTAKKVALAQPAKYAGLLKNQCVMVETEARKEAIRRLSEQAVRRVHGRVLMLENLLQQVSNLVEHPVAILGSFDPAYLNLPSEVLITCLEHHQKFFPVVEEKEGRLLPHFIGIRNGMSLHQDIVREGYERVLAARLADARFFYNQDRKTPLSSKVEALKGVMFQEKLGNLFEKKERIKALLESLRQNLGNPSWLDPAFQVADLCKADLVTEMVREFPELQGVMARLYAVADGENKIVSQALEQHYWPITLTGSLPSSETAAIVSLADKLDTLAGDFAVGLIPSGSADPYGLRRAAVGILRILEAKNWRLELGHLLRIAIAAQPVKEHQDETFKMLAEFMKQRIHGWLSERGIHVHVIEAALGSNWEVIPTLLSRLPALQQVPPAFSEVAKRVNNIIRQVKQKKEIYETLSGVRPELLSNPSEVSLFSSLSERKSIIQEALAREDFAVALQKLAELKDPLDVFFKGVMVMVDDIPLRNNRLSLLHDVHALCAQIADFSKLQNA